MQVSLRVGDKVTAYDGALAGEIVGLEGEGGAVAMVKTSGGTKRFEAAQLDKPFGHYFRVEEMKARFREAARGELDVSPEVFKALVRDLCVEANKPALPSDRDLQVPPIDPLARLPPGSP